MAFRDKDKAETYIKQWRKENSEKVKGYALAWYYRNHDRVRETANAMRREQYTNPEWRSKLAAYRKQLYLKFKAKCFSHYGNACECCGESRTEFLSVDHVNGGGTRQRKATKLAGQRMYAWLVKHNYPGGYRLLCHNCNQSLGYHKFCPHQLEQFVSHAPTLTDFYLATVVGL